MNCEQSCTCVPLISKLEGGQINRSFGNLCLTCKIRCITQFNESSLGLP